MAGPMGYFGRESLSLFDPRNQNHSERCFQRLDLRAYPDKSLPLCRCALRGAVPFYRPYPLSRQMNDATRPTAYTGIRDSGRSFCLCSF